MGLLQGRSIFTELDSILIYSLQWGMAKYTRKKKIKNKITNGAQMFFRKRITIRRQNKWNLF